MKRSILFFIIIALLFHFSFHMLNAANHMPDSDIIAGVKNNVALFFNAQRNGDINGIKQYMAEEYYQSRKTLLDHNEEYPAFLRKYFNGVEIFVGNATLSDEDIIVEVTIQYPNGTKRLSEIHLRQEDNIPIAGDRTADSSMWKVFKVN